MSRPVRFFIPAIFVSFTLAATGCKTVYSDMYSPRRNHFIPKKEKPKAAPEIPVLETTPTTTPAPDLGLPPAAPTSAPAPVAPADAAPMIPGL